MPVYWSILFVTTIVCFIGTHFRQRKFILEGRTVYRISPGVVIFSVAYLLLFVCFRDYVMDTYSYKEAFYSMPTEWNAMLKEISEMDSDWGFYFLQGAFKILVSDNHYAWFSFVGIVSCFFLFRPLYKYSCDFPLTMYLFIAGTTFTWLLNGARQFLAACILFGFSDWLIKGKKLQYILLSLLVSLFHSSAIFLAFICLFVSSKKILDFRMILFGIITTLGINYSEGVFTFLKAALDMDYSEALSSTDGSSIIRLLISGIPILIVLIMYRYIKYEAPPSIRLAINMSFIGDCFYLAASFTNGILIGRMPIYFTIYNLYLLPWLIHKCFTKNSVKLVLMLTYGFYLLYFYYQIVISWSGMEYVSKFLNLYYHH